MKMLKAIAVTALIGLSYNIVTAQEKLPINQPEYHKPTIFDDLPKTMILTIPDMETLFDFPVGSAVTAKLAKSFHLKGTIVSKAGDSHASVRSVVVKSLLRQGAVLTFTKITGDDGRFIYRGRILCRESIDAYEIQEENDQYVLRKKNYYEMVTE